MEMGNLISQRICSQQMRILGLYLIVSIESEGNVTYLSLIVPYSHMDHLWKTVPNLNSFELIIIQISYFQDESFKQILLNYSIAVEIRDFLRHYTQMYDGPCLNQ